MPFTLEKNSGVYEIDTSLLQPRYSSTEDYASDGTWSPAPANTFPQSLKDAILARLKVVMDTRRNVVGPSQEPNPSGSGVHYTGYAVPLTVLPPKPEDQISELKIEPIRSTNSNFAARKKAGEIVVAPYRSKGFVRVKRVAGIKDISSTARGSLYLMVGLAGSAGFVVSGTRWYYKPRYYIEPWTTSFVKVRTRTYTSDWVIPKFWNASELYPQLKEYEPPPELVTEVWGNNNRKRLDFLTTMAEIPKTVSSMLDSLGYLANLIVELKRGRFYLNKSRQRQINELGKDVNARRIEIIKSFDQKISRARKPWLKQKLRYKKQKQLASLERYRKRKDRQMYREFTTQMSSLWLKFRYEVMPLVYTAEDALDVIASATSDYITSRDRVTLPMTLTPDPGWGLNQPVVEIPREIKVMVKSRLRPENSYSKTMSSNPFSTAWELLTLSFVVDWFINIGDVIAAYTGGYSDTSGATSSLKLDSTSTYTYKGITGAYVELSTNFYTRNTIDPRLCGGLVIRPELNLFRYLDAMSLTWSRSRLKISRAN